MGTFLVSVFTQITGNASFGVLSIAVLFINGLLLSVAMKKSDRSK